MDTYTNNLYQLLNKNKLLGELTITQDEDGIQKFLWVTRYEEIPYWLEDINNWISERIAVGRVHIGRLYDALNIHNISTFIHVCNAASLMDTLWIKEASSDITWERVNLFKNKFNTSISSIALSGDTIKLSGLNKFRSPEYTTLGSYDKCWKRENGNIVLVKKGLEKYSEGSGNEPFSEYYASYLLKNLLGLEPYRDFVPYTVSRYNESYFVSKCTCFTSEKYGMIPMSLADVNRYSTEDFLKFMHKLNPYSEWLFRWMSVFDFISLNPDRHVGNIGLIIDNDTLNIVRMAPIFDNNLSFYPKITILDRPLNRISASLSEIKPKYDINFGETLQQVLTRDMINQLEKMYTHWKNNKFTRVEGISQERIDIMNKVTKLKVEKILNL